jgi:hypothetical protein
MEAQTEGRNHKFQRHTVILGKSMSSYIQKFLNNLWCDHLSVHMAWVLSNLRNGGANAARLDS